MSDEAPRRVFLETIRARMVLVLAVTLGLLTVVTVVSAVVMWQVQSVVDDFIVRDLPRSQNTRSLNHLVDGVALGAQRLARARTKADLEESYNQIDVLLLRLDITADGLSRSGVDSETLQITRRLQDVRSEAQLGFQLKGLALDLASELARTRTRGLDSSTRLAGLVRLDGSQPGAALSPLTAAQRRTVWRSTRVITTLLATAALEGPDPGGAAADLEASVAALQDVRDGLPPGASEATSALRELLDLDWPRYLAQRQRQLELTRTAETLLENLPGTVDGVVSLLDGYTRGLLTGFERRKDEVLALGRWAVLLVVLVSVAGAVAVVLVQRRLVMEGFSRRLDVISRALARLPATPDDTRVSVTGSDEIAAMARRLEVLLEKALRLQVIVTTDELTQVHNRRSFFELTAIQRKQAARSRRVDSLLMMDIDHFKRVNDSHGHDVGDRVLRTVAQACLGCLRDTDVLARLGGEEFGVYCPDTSLDAGRKLAERLCSTVRGLDVEGIPQRVTVSVGVTEIPPDADSMTRWIKRADQALYSAKAQGRDRVVIADPGSDAPRPTPSA